MFLAHFGVGLAAKPAAARTSLGTLLFAAQFLDLLWPTLLLLGIESVEIRPGITQVTPLEFVSYPISHSLVLVLVWALLFAIVYGLFRKYPLGALVAAGCVASHWLLDSIVHRPDLPIAPGSGVKVGLGLWTSLPGTLALELALFGLGLALYARRTRAKDRIGCFGLWGLALFLLVLYGAAVFGPPPPSTGAIAWTGEAQWLIVLFGGWVDRHREIG